MTSQINLFLLSFLVSFIISLILTPLVRKAAVRFKLVDQPSRQHPAILHSFPVPRAGGIAIYLGIAISAILFAHRDLLLAGLLFGGLINVLVGTIDDRHELSPYLRFGFQILSAIIVVLVGVSFYIGNPFTGEIIYFNNFSINLPGLSSDTNLVIPADLILIFWIVLMMNTANWSKGASQLPGVAVVAFLTLAGVALEYQSGNPEQQQTALLAIISAGAILAFVPFNFPPEKMFPGFGGSTLIGFNLALLSVLSGGKVATILIVFALPLIDALLVGIKRIINRKNPFIHDREHLYHFLLDAGFSKKQIIYFYWITSAILGIITIFLKSWGKIIMIGLLTILISTFFVLLYVRKKNRG